MNTTCTNQTTLTDIHNIILTMNMQPISPYILIDSLTEVHNPERSNQEVMTSANNEYHTVFVHGSIHIEVTIKQQRFMKYIYICILHSNLPIFN